MRRRPARRARPPLARRPRGDSFTASGGPGRRGPRPRRLARPGRRRSRSSPVPRRATGPACLLAPPGHTAPVPCCPHATERGLPTRHGEGRAVANRDLARRSGERLGDRVCSKNMAGASRHVRGQRAPPFGTALSRLHCTDALAAHAAYAWPACVRIPRAPSSDACVSTSKDQTPGRCLSSVLAFAVCALILRTAARCMHAYLLLPECVLTVVAGPGSMCMHTIAVCCQSPAVKRSV